MSSQPFSNFSSIPFNEKSEVEDNLCEVLHHAREIKATEFAFVIRGKDGVIATGFHVSKDYFGLVGALEEIKRRILSGDPDE